MEKTQTLTLALAMFGIAILLTFDFITLPSYAIDFVDITGINAPDFPVATTIGTTSVFKVFLTSAPIQVNTYNANTGALISTGADLTTTCETGGTPASCQGRIMDCLSGTCYVLAVVTIGTTRWRLMNANTNTIIGTGATSPSSPLNAMDCTTTHCYFAYDVSGAERFVSIRLSDGAETTIIGDLGLSAYAGSLNILSINSISYYTVTGDIINSWFDIYRTDTLTGCSSTGTQTALDAETDGTYFYVALTGGTISIRNTACTEVGTISSANLCGGSSLQDIEISGTNLYSYCESNNKIAQTDITTPLSASLVVQFGCFSGVPALGNYQKPLAYSSGSDSLMCANYTNDGARIIIISGESTEDDVACIDTNLDGVTDVCFTDTNNDGVADNGSSGALGAFNSNANVTDMGTQWFCAFNLGDACNNSDVKTNGVGLFYLGFLVVVSYALLVSIHIMAVKQLHSNNVQVMDYLKINPYLLLMTLVIDVGLVWYLGWVEDLIFYTLITLLAVGLGIMAFKHTKGGVND